MSNARQIKTPEAMRAFVTAGRAYFTLLNRDTQGRVTYCVDKNEDVPGAFIVRSFTGSDNADRRSYSYLGDIEANGTYVYAGPQAAVDAVLVAAEEAHDSWTIGFCKNVRRDLAAGKEITAAQQGCLARKGKKYKVSACPIPETDVKAKGFAWFWRQLSPGRTLPNVFQFWSEGRCCVCGKRLTVPESIERSIGPECAEKMGIEVIQITHPV